MDVMSHTGSMNEMERQLAVRASLDSQGIELGRGVAVSFYSAVFEVERYRGWPVERKMVAKLPWRLAGPVADSLDRVEQGPSRMEPTSLTGPFVLTGPATEEEVAALIEEPCRRQLACSRQTPLVPLVELVSAAGRPVALFEWITEFDLRWMMKHWPGRARRLLPIGCLCFELARRFRRPRRLEAGARPDRL